MVSTQDGDPAVVAEETATEQFMAVVDQAARTKAEAPTYAKTAWFCLDRDAQPRKLCISIVSNPYFDYTVLSLIALNCATMMWFNEPVLAQMIAGHPEDFDIRSTWAANERNVVPFRPLSTTCSNGPCSINGWIDWGFLVLFSVEAVLKLVAQGFIMHPKAYLRQGWNWLDFVVVIFGFLEMYAGLSGGMRSLRLIKTLRPLRSLQRIRGMRVLVQCILEAMPQMCNVLVFLFFIIIFFALVGVALFGGANGGLRYSCHYLESDGVTWTSTEVTCAPGCTWNEMTVELEGAWNGTTPPCTSFGSTTMGLENWGMSHYRYTCRPGQQCRCTDDGEVNPTCSFRSNPNHGITSFDSMPWAIISLFQAISLEGWVDMMYALMDGVSWGVFIYFILLVLIGAIIVINLFLAVLCDNFEIADRDGEEKVKEEEGAKVVAREVATLKHSNAFRQAVLNLVKHKYFDVSIQLCIIFNTIIMMMNYAPMPTRTLTMSIDLDPETTFDGLPYMLGLFIFVMNLVLTSIFTLESILKIIGLGPRLFSRDSMNLFDVFVVVFSIVDIALDLVKKATGTGVEFPLPISVLRAFRTFRLFKLVRSVPSLRKILATLAQSMASVVYLAMLLVLMILIFILLGMELFGGSYPRTELNFTQDKFPMSWLGDDGTTQRITWDGDASRYHFDDVGNAALVIFVVLSGENWNEIMFDSHTATFDYNVSVTPPFPYAIIYFIALFVLGNLLLFNLFIAILLSNFDDDEEEEEGEEEDDELTATGEKGAEGSIEALSAAPKPEPMMEWKFNGYMQTFPAGLGGVAGESKAATSSTRASKTGADGAAVNGVEEEEADEEAKPQELYPKTVEDMRGDRSMYIFSWQNPIRTFLAKVVNAWIFEQVVVLAILVSTVLMLCDMPHYPETHWSRQAISATNSIFAIAFLIEMLMKWIVYGVIINKTLPKYACAQPYFRSMWNILDFVIVVISLLTMANIKELNPLRAARALRPLRLVSRNEDLKITVATLFSSLPAMGSLCSVALLFFAIFAILGTELYGGKLGYCMDPLYADMPYGSRVVPGLRTYADGKSQTDYEECMALPRYNITRRTTRGILFTDMEDQFPNDSPNWVDFVEYPQWFYPQWGNFDNLALSVFLLFEISALEGWPDVMHVAMDADMSNQHVSPWRVSEYEDNGFGGVGVKMESHMPSRYITAVFFIAWIIVGCFVVINMTVGVVVDTFSQIKAENDGLLLMSEDAADWVKAQKQVFAQRPLVQAAPPAAPWRLNIYYLVTSTKFDIAVVVVILANMVQMGCDFWEPHLNTDGTVNEPNIVAVKQAMQYLNIVFLFIYVCEMLLKWIGLGVVQYFKNPPDSFDFILVAISVIEASLSFVPNVGLPIGFIRTLRLFRVVRILRVIKTAKSLRTVIMTVYISIPQLKNIMLLMALIIIIVDVVCVSLFNSVNYTPGNTEPPTPDGQYLETTARGEVLPQDDSWFFSSDGTNWGDMINRHANFQFWWTGFLVLVRSATGESFNGIMHDLFGYEWGDNRLKCCPECGPILDRPTRTYTYTAMTVNGLVETSVTGIQPDSSCGLTWIAMVIYLVFQILMSYIVLSIMIGVILENFTNVGSETRKIRVDDLEEFREVWLKYDPKGTFIVPSHNLLAILQQLKTPLGIAGANPALTRAEMLKHLGKLDIPDHGGYIHFMETLTAVSHHHAGVPVPVCDTTKKMQKAAQQVPKLKVLDKPAHNALTNYLVSLLQSRWRGYAMRKKYDDDPSNAGSADAPPPLAPQKVKANQVAPEPTPPA